MESQTARRSYDHRLKALVAKSKNLCWGNFNHNCVIVKIAHHCTRSTISSQFFLCASLNSFAPLNKTHKADCRKYFDIARGSAMECGATIDVCHILGLVSDVKKTQTNELLHPIVAPC